MTETTLYWHSKTHTYDINWKSIVLYTNFTYNIQLDSKSESEDWQNVKVTPVYKKADVFDFRPISILLAYINYAFEIFLKHQMTEYISDSKKIK